MPRSFGLFNLEGCTGWFRGDWGLVVVFLLIAANSALMAFLRPDETLSPDSLGYLELARNLASGEGYIKDGVYSGVWPLGYPMAIAAVIKVTGLGAYWASKAANLLLIGLALLSLRNLMKADAALLGSVLLTATGLALGPMTWSEIPFLCFMMMFVTALAGHHRKPTLPGALAIVLFGLLVFLSRWVGLFILLPIAVIGLWHLGQRDLRRFATYLVVGLAILGLALAYLGFNITATGHATGMEREVASMGASALLTDLGRALLFQLNPVRLGFASQSLWQTGLWCATALPVLIGAIVLVRRWRQSDPEPKPGLAEAPAWPFFLLVALAYLLAIIGIRLFFSFDTFTYRLVGPGVLLVWMALIDAALRRPSLVCWFRVRWVLLILLTFLVNPLGKATMSALRDDQAYSAISALYATLPENAVVLFIHPTGLALHPTLRWRDDLHVRRGDDLETLIATGCHGMAGPVYLRVKPYIADLEDVDPSVRQQMAGRQGDSLYRIGSCPLP
ncbi:MAG: hypothetical protein ACPGNT_02580 [Rhodospirillales bacterium]